ncbi:MAG: IS630 family transposase [Acidobacteria bacterium]|nr:IS630 family transposase [Acidobacteriota bacterium]
MCQGRYSTFELRVRAVEAVHRGLAMVQVAEAFNVDRTTLFRWVQKYHTYGQDGLQRRPVGGRPRLLDDLEEKELRWLVMCPASDFGYETDLWTVGRLQQVIAEVLEVTVSKDTVWRRLRDAGLTYQKPERQYFEVDEKARQKWLRTEVPRIRHAVREFRAILYFQDESNVSLTAFLGKTWGLCGQTPRVPVTGKRGGVSAMSALSGQGRLLFRLFDKRICSGEVIYFLDQMLQFHKGRHLVVVMDQAPPHTSHMTTAYIEGQRRLHVFYLPKYSPDWNPDEKVWNHLKHQELKAHQAKTKEELKVLTKDKLKRMSKNPSLLRGLFFRCCVAELFG